MAAKVLYFKNTNPNGASGFGALQDGASITALNQGAGWAIGTHAVGDFGPIAGPFTELPNGSGLWTTNALPSTNLPSDSIGDAYRSELPYYGQFANTDWSFSVVLRSTAVSWDGRLKLHFRVFKGIARDGTDATELTSGLVSTAATTAALSTTVDRTVTATWSPGGTITLDGHFLFVKIALEVTTQGTNAGNARIRSGSTTSVTTPDWTPATGPKQLWLKDAVPAGATNHRSLQDGGSAITGATTGTGWTAGTNANTLYCIQNGGSEIPLADGQWTTTAQPAAASLSTTIGDAWRSENALTGTFENKPWGFQFAGRSVTGNYTGRYSIRIRVYKSANQDGSSATELTSGPLASPVTVQSHATSQDTVSTISWVPGSTLTFNSEYLFVQVAIDISTAGGGASLDVLLRVGSAAFLGVFTPNLQASAPIEATASITDAADTAAATGDADIGVTASLSDADDTVAATGDADVSATRTGTDAADTLASNVHVVPLAAPKTFYFKDAVPAGATLHRSLQDGGSITAATTGTGWVVDQKAAGQMCIQNGNVEVGRTDAQWGATAQPAAAPSQTIGDCWRSENTLTGTFANANWSFTFAGRSVTAAYTGRMRLRFRVWKSANANGTSPTELTGSTQVTSTTTGNLSTTADTTFTATWSPGTTLPFANQYLFVQVAVEVTSVGSSNTHDFDFRVGSAAGYGIVTSNFTAEIIREATASITDAADTIASSADADASVSLSATDDADTLSTSGGPAVAASVSATDAADTVAASVEVVAAPETNATVDYLDDEDSVAATDVVIDAGSASITDAADVVAASATVEAANETNATFAGTDAADTLAASAGARAAASLSATDAADTLAASLGARASASLSATDAADTVAAEASVPIPGAVTVTFSRTDAADTLSAAAGAALSATLARTDAADAVTSALAAAIGATLARTDAADGVSSSLTVRVSLSLSKVDAQDSVAATVDVEQPGITEATLAVTDAADGVVAALSARVSASRTAADAADTVSASAIAPVSVIGTFADGADSISGTFRAVASVQASATDAADTVAAILYREIVVSLSVFDADDSVVSTVETIDASELATDPRYVALGASVPFIVRSTTPPFYVRS